MKTTLQFSWVLFIFLSQILQAQTPFNCPYCDLSGQDFSGKNLQDANLLGAKLDNVNLQGADLTGAYLSRASLQGANLQQAKMGTSTKGVSNFSLADLTNANFAGASIGATVFFHATLNNTNFSNTDLSQAKFGIVPTLSAQNAVNTIMPQPYVNAKLVAVPAGNSVYVNDGTGVDNSTCGALGSPCKTIYQGINNCTGNPCNVLVEYGQYTTPSGGWSINLKPGVNLFGGYYNGQPTDAQSVITLNSDATNGTHATIWGSNIGGNITIANFIINGLATTSNNGPSMVMQLNNCSNVQLANVNINAAKGGTGTKGADAVKASDGGTGGTGTTSSGGTGGVSAHPSNNAGGRGGNQTAGKATCDGGVNCSVGYDYSGSSMDGSSGQPATTGYIASGSSRAGKSPKVCTGWLQDAPGQNTAGTNGHSGYCGGTNSASSDITGHFSNGLWVGTSANQGTSGGYGGGGGGGGGGSAVAYCNCVCGNPDQHYGTGGGGGGAGGEGAAGGMGGMQGGASIGILLYVSTCVFGDDVKIVGGSGGDGGNGGNGASGGNGGAGGDGGPTNNIGDSGGTGGKGGRGGSGGMGGASGGGAGGNGGPSYCIAQVTDSQGHTSSISGTPQYYQGISGAVGNGGNGGVSSGSCTAGKGANGVAGNVLTVWQTANQ
ncbi:pentapeptide repeat-containing protein [Runella aurantiaca]|uniref:Pentapeptide repeat-containing protein n=1 Tax=Runella aurantiaca TaxID=2282308 RepID=A0A369HZ05_9BACT|nr:pentapeptide repeat-containing protein [Runella aurantiaca]RDB02588.1 pentapeptide repeat-containing protein [Runella aurantiaca]